MRYYGYRFIIEPEKEEAYASEGGLYKVKAKVDTLKRGVVISGPDQDIIGKTVYYTVYGCEVLGDYIVVEGDMIWAIED